MKVAVARAESSVQMARLREQEAAAEVAMAEAAEAAGPAASRSTGRPAPSSQARPRTWLRGLTAVSYTHLTLPTKA